MTGTLTECPTQKKGRPKLKQEHKEEGEGGSFACAVVFRRRLHYTVTVRNVYGVLYTRGTHYAQQSKETVSLPLGRTFTSVAAGPVHSDHLVFGTTSREVGTNYGDVHYVA